MSYDFSKFIKFIITCFIVNLVSRGCLLFQLLVSIYNWNNTGMSKSFYRKYEKEFIEGIWVCDTEGTNDGYQ